MNCLSKQLQPKVNNYIKILKEINNTKKKTNHQPSIKTYYN